MKRVALKRTKGIKPRSARMAAKYVLRRALVSRLLAEHPVCEFYELITTRNALFPNRCQDGSVHVHERLTRARLGSILDESNCVALCAEHHRWIHDHPAEATAGGWLVSRWPKPAG